MGESEGGKSAGQGAKTEAHSQLRLRRLRRSQLPVDTVALARYLIGKIVVRPPSLHAIAARNPPFEANPSGTHLITGGFGGLGLLAARWLVDQGARQLILVSRREPSAEAAHQPCEVVILFDTSASQTGPYRDTSFAALEACIAKLRPEHRVQLLAVDLEARPITSQFVPAGSAELRAAVEKLRGE